jgi:hypothetical protein
MGLISRIFVVTNRIFGAFVVLGGFSLMLNCVWVVAHGRSLADVWIGAAFGVVMMLVGIVYLRAPLRRASKDPRSALRGE